MLVMYIYIYSFSILLSKATYNCYVRGCMPLEQLGVKCLAQGHIGVSQWIRTQVSHTKGMCLIHHHPYQL